MRGAAGRRALYPGSFDPITNGHLDVIERATRLFDEVWVTVFSNSQKRPLFDAAERVALAEAATRHLRGVRVDQSRSLLVEYARSIGAGVIIRGLRAVLDFDYEFQMALMNKRLAPDIETVFMLTRENYSYLSSTLVKELAAYGADISGLVPAAVEAALKAKFASGRETGPADRGRNGE
ncbi:phosphopantetheine adenylyltransferase [Candidatus Hydrogenisulfobacillus filiaventi]|uniref:Phosphopantetheine adenylyltransferase n=1 Tax=Candidatus Hydrogenisulfobacillus filiaventi TaxID=2707344 RepID=A0A6F8ZH89_9FIRM|nr:pantetheine-phosphate adenylyltransferase [Bacillota bacterium]CAB1129124.1 phosphopantetheine adenylyltransferase [Candidatus Hydrogenisulfobacillus filiaventi]